MDDVMINDKWVLFAEYYESMIKIFYWQQQLLHGVRAEFLVEMCDTHFYFLQ